MHASIRPGLWVSPDCDLQVLSRVPRELAFAVVAATLAKHREELAKNIVEAGGPGEQAAAILDAVPDLSAMAARLRVARRPRGRVLSRLSWSLRQARIVLESFTPPINAEDPVLEDRAFDLLAKVVFLIDILDAWRDPKAATAASAARKTG